MLQSERITLRAPEPEDLDLLYKWENDPALWPYGYTINPLSKKALSDFIAQCSENLFETRQTRWMIVDRLTNEAVGTVDLFELDAFHQRIGTGILIDPSHRRKGLALEALTLVCDYCFTWLHLHQIFAHIPARNEASRALFVSAGFKENGTLKGWIRSGGQFEDVVVMQLISE